MEKTQNDMFNKVMSTEEKFATFQLFRPEPAIGRTLLYEMASNNSLICAGFWMSSSLEDRGWEEARASTANTLWTSLSTMRSFWWERSKFTSIRLSLFKDLVKIEMDSPDHTKSPHSMWVQRRTRQNLHLSSLRNLRYSDYSTGKVLGEVLTTFHSGSAWSAPRYST